MQTTSGTLEFIPRQNMPVVVELDDVILVAELETVACGSNA